MHTFCRRRKSTAERLGRSPGSEVQSVLCGCFTFPGRWPSGRSKQRPHSQWRDRAGFTPDFPVMPLAGTQTRLALYHDRVCMANSKFREHFARVPRSCEDCAVRDLAVLLLHLPATVARLAGPGGARSVAAESVLVKFALQRSALPISLAGKVALVAGAHPECERLALRSVSEQLGALRTSIPRARSLVGGLSRWTARRRECLQPRALLYTAPRGSGPWPQP